MHWIPSIRFLEAKLRRRSTKKPEEDYPKLRSRNRRIRSLRFDLNLRIPPKRRSLRIRSLRLKIRICRGLFRFRNSPRSEIRRRIRIQSRGIKPKRAKTTTICSATFSLVTKTCSDPSNPVMPATNPAEVSSADSSVVNPAPVPKTPLPAPTRTPSIRSTRHQCSKIRSRIKIPSPDSSEICSAAAKKVKKNKWISSNKL